jgi:ubiquinone/menaquinone biosynthesis C-methylase UbiE
MNQRAVNDFDSIASVYDTLASLIFGKSLRRSQLCFLPYVPDGASVLIVGGGSGELLAALLHQKPTCRVTYVDASAAMIARARKRVQGSGHVTFVHGTEHAVSPVQRFQVIITNFYFDMFLPHSLAKVITHLKLLLAEDGAWLVTDFLGQHKWWQRLLLKTMYVFFRVASNIEASAISDWQQHLYDEGLRCQRRKLFFHGFISSTIFKLAYSSTRSPSGS